MFIDTIFPRWLELRLDGDTWESPDEQLSGLLQRFNGNELLACEEYKDKKDEVHKQFMDDVRRLDLMPDHVDMDAVVEMSNECEKQISVAREELLLALNEDNRHELERIWEMPNKPPSFNLGLVKRYILWRVFDLGWTVERFGDFDSFIIGDSGRRAHQSRAHREEVPVDSLL